MRKLFYILLAAVLLTSCKTKYVTVPEYHQIFVEKRDTFTRIDSIYEKDSIYIVKNGDTITAYKTKILYRDRWRERIVYRDSIKVDSIRVPYPVEKPLSNWQRMWINAGKVLGLVFSCVLCLIVVRLWLRARSNC